MRALIYSPDSYGLGHVRRSTSMARALLRTGSGSSVLLLTGAPRAHLFDYPTGCDPYRLPPITKDASGRYISRTPELSFDEAIKLRERLISRAADQFPMDVFLVDHAPRGISGEVLPTLRRLGEGPGPLRVLGMRDVIDEPAVVRSVWARDDVMGVLDECYDLVLVYGQKKLFDPVLKYGIPQRIARKVVFAGYIPRNGRKAQPRELRARFAPRTGRLVVVTLGGGGDGNQLLRSFLEGYEGLLPDPPFEAVAVTGPLMSPKKRERFQEWADRLPGLTLLEYAREMPDLVEAAHFTVSMGGYNTVCELACAGARSLIVPRTFPRKEQLIRARILAERGVADCLPSEPTEGRPDPRVLMDRVLTGLEGPRPERGWGLDFHGLTRAARTIGSLVKTVPSSRVAGMGGTG